MDLLKEKEYFDKLRKNLKEFSKKEIYSKMVDKDNENVSEDLRYAFEYIDETIKSLANSAMCIYHANLFLENAWKKEVKTEVKEK